MLRSRFARVVLPACLVALGVLVAVLSLRTLVFSSRRSSGESSWPTPTQRSFQHVPVVLVVFDELPLVTLLNERGRIDRKLFPNFSRLADDSVWFRNTTAVAVLSQTAVPALMTGKYLNPRGPHPRVYPRNLLTMVGKAFDVRTVQPDPRFCSSRICPQSEIELTATDPRFGDFGRSARGRNFRSFLEILQPRRRDAFYYLHLVAPHAPWSFLPSGRRYQPDRRPAADMEVSGPGRAWKKNTWLVTQAQQQHFLQVQLVDRLVGALIDRLRSEDMYERALVVVTADHGMAFEPGFPKRDTRKETIGEIATVPLFIKRPFEEEGKVSDRPIDLVDIVPTIADILNLSHVWEGLDGTSAFGRMTFDDAERSVSGIPLSPDGDAIDPAIERKYEWFGQDGSSIDLFELGPGTTEKLLGRAVKPLTAHGDSAATIQLQRRPGGLRPQVTATVTDVSKRPPVVAIAVDGKIVAVTKAHETDGATRFSAMIPPRARSEPWADVQLFVVTREAGYGWGLLPVTIPT